MHALLALVVFLLAPFARAVDGHASAVMHARADPAHPELVRIAIAITIEPRWHLYHGPAPSDVGDEGASGLPTTVDFDAADFGLSPIRIAEKPELVVEDLGDGPKHVRQHTGSMTIHVLAKAKRAGADPATIVAHVSGLTCGGNGSCIPWSEDVKSSGAGPDALFASFPADLVVGASASSAPKPPERAVATPALDDARLAAVVFPDYAPRGEDATHGLGVWLVLAFVAGILLNVMPCVLPVVSIKVLGFVQQARERRGRVVALALAFAAGVLAVFLVLASLAAFAGKGWGEQFQDPRFLVVMIAVVFAFALSMLGVFTIGVPSSIGGGAIGGAGARSSGGLGDAFAKGALATVLATPCSGPFLGSTLAWALRQPAAVVFLVFATIGAGMAAPYVLLAAIPSATKLVPRPGAWMETFERATGFVLLATVVYLMTSLRQDLLLFTIAFLVFVGAACWTWGRYATLDQSRTARAGTVAAVLAIVAVGARLAFVDLRGLYAPSAGRLAWVDFDPELLARSAAEGRNVFVDFTASWCPNCKYNEHRVYESEPFAELVRAKDVLAMRADITHDGARTEMIRRLMDELGARSIPLAAVFPGDAPTRPFVRPDVVSVSGMTAVLEACPTPRGR